MGSAPKRKSAVYMVGAGLSCSLGLPNTAALLNSITELAERSGSPLPGRAGGRRGRTTKKDAPRLEPSSGLLHAESLKEALEALYPDGSKESFYPDTVDFFSAVQAFIDIGAPGLVGVQLKDAPALMRTLRFSIARLLVERLRDAESGNGGLGSHAYLQQMVRPGNVVITSNWDTAIERFAMEQHIDVRRVGDPGDSYVLLLKLHGSIDWCQLRHGKRLDSAPDDYAPLREFKARLPVDGGNPGDVVRIRVLESWPRAWQVLKSRTEEPFIVTMYRGKGEQIGAITDIWRSAYHALSRAKTLEIVGYSMPQDDLEIRTLLRAGIDRGRQSVKVTVRNPSPDVHARIRQQVHARAESDYRPV